MFAKIFSFLPFTQNCAAVLNCSETFFTTLSESNGNYSRSPSHLLSLDVSLTNWILIKEFDQKPQSSSNNNAPSRNSSRLIALAPFIDPHFHIWDMSECHDPEILSGFKERFFRFSLKDLESILLSSNSRGDHHRTLSVELDFCGGMHIEAIAKNFDGVREAKWVRNQITEHNDNTKKNTHQQQRKYFVSGYLNFLHPNKTRDELVQDLKEMLAPPVSACSVRQILNFEPSWPHVTENFLENEKWLENFDYISSHAGLKVFEAQINPHQFEACGKNLIAKHPNMKFVMNHLGCLTGKDLNNAESFKKYLRDLQNHLAVYPNVFMKLSMMEYAFFEEEKKETSCPYRHWSQSPRIRQLVGEVIRIFGVDRCVLASNFPVSIFRLYHEDGKEEAEEEFEKKVEKTVVVWKNWVCRLLQDGIQNPRDYYKIASKNTARIYGL